MAMISENIARLKAHIQDICSRLGRDPRDVVVVAVTKYSDISHIQEAVAAGVTHIAENRLQQAIGKYGAFDHVTKHMIGHLQTNKVKQAVQIFDMIQSVDSLRLAQEIDCHCGRMNRRMSVLVQVNTSGEHQKFGIAPDQVFDLLKRMAELQHIRVQGLMTIAPFTDHIDVIRNCFKGLRDLFDRAQQEFLPDSRLSLRFLSMGMSGDYPLALEQGANMLRIGQGIFLPKVSDD